MNKDKIQYMLDFALNQAKLSKCTDKGTAALLVSSDLNNIFSIGINGGPKGGEQCLCDDKSKYTCVHAEINCLVKAKTFDTNPKILICTKAPCHTCASAIINSELNIQQVWYIEDYHDHKGLSILRNAGINIKQFER